MSTRQDQPEKSSGSKMLKKAKSFRDDIKTKIKRRPSTGAQQMIPENNAPKKKSGKAVSRTNSMNEGTKTDNVEDIDDADKLQMEVQEVNRTLNYIIRAVVTQEKHEVLPPSATLVLETVMNVFTLLSNHLLNQDSTKLASYHNKVCQCLAKFIRWSDGVLMKSEDPCDKDTANEIIAALSDGIKDLTQLCIEKMAARKSSLPKSPTPNNGGLDVCSKRSSLPDIPLTPRERQILKQTSEMGIYDNTTISRSSDSLSSPTIFSFDQEDTPPPKPPLPQGANSMHPGMTGMDSVDGAEMPPPLPEKRRSASNMNDLLSSTTSTTSLTPTQSPQSSMLISPTGEILMGNVTPFSQSPHSVSPMSRSPTSSVGSGLNKSTEDLLAAGQRNSRTNSFSRMSSEGQIFSSTSSSSSSSSVMRTSVTKQAACDQINNLTYQINQLTSSIDDKPPALPMKKGISRLTSMYDNVPDSMHHVCSTGALQSNRSVFTKTMESRISSSSTCSSQSSHSSQSAQSFMSVLTQKSSSSSALLYCSDRASQETYSSSETFSSATSHSSTESLPKPPPLPPKKRHIHAYMQTFGSYTQPSSLECISRHSINFYEAQWHQHQMELFQPLYPRSNTISVISDISNFSSESSFSSGSPDRFMGIPALPQKMKRPLDMNRQSFTSTGSSQSDMSNSAGDIREKTVSLLEPPVTGQRPLVELDAKRQSAPATVGPTIIPAPPPKPAPRPVTPPPSPVPEKMEIQKDADSDFAELNALDDIDVSDQLVRKGPGEDGPDIRGGSIDALVVHATAAGKSEFIYQEAFLTTYRTFLLPKELIDKLLYRFYKFQHSTDKKRLSRNAFSLLVRVVDELGCRELEEEVVRRMMDLVYELVCQGELMLARILRRKIIEKCEHRQKVLADLASNVTPVQSINLQQNLPDLLHYKSQEIAEQMTLSDAGLFQKIEIPEVLLWAREQSEDLSPNLTRFTEHFNSMSYWCRTRILTQDDPKEREKYLIKFIKIMKYLRKMSNFNSYLAILSALDSAPVRRLEWPKQNLEALKEFCQLIDSSSSFRAYRQALSETEPPCIPYLGLILQDLTFINIGNQDLLPDQNINFSKRWQQFNILDSMRRFKKCNYEFKKNEKILSHLNGFQDYLSEEQLWQISEKIKPRVVRKKVDAD